MTDDHSRRGAGDDTRRRSYRESTGIPRWALISGIIAAVAILLIVIVMTASGGDGGGHQPRRHGLADGADSYPQSALVLPSR